MTSAGGTDVFAAKFGGDGNHVWSERFGGAYGDTGYAVSSWPDGRSVVAGRFSGFAEFGSQSLTSLGSDDGFAAELAP